MNEPFSFTLALTPNILILIALVFVLFVLILLRYGKYAGQVELLKSELKNWEESRDNVPLDEYIKLGNSISSMQWQAFRALEDIITNLNATNSTQELAKIEVEKHRP